MANNSELLEKKIVIVGDTNTGKTTFVHRLLFNEYIHRHIPTVGVEINIEKMKKPYKVIWDVSGQEKFTTVDENVRITFMERLKKYVKNAERLIVFFDTTSKKTYTNAFTWAEKVREICPEIPIRFVGTKIDLKPDTSNNVFEVEHSRFEKEFDADYLEISNRTALGMSKVLQF